MTAARLPAKKMRIKRFFSGKNLLSVSVPEPKPTNGSGSRRPKNIRIQKQSGQIKIA
jgi:hypothetical protein